MDNVYTPSKRNCLTARQTPPAEVSSSLKDIQLEYARALDQIESLKLEKDHLKKELRRTIDDQAEVEYRDHSISIERASNSLKQSYAQKALIQSEQRMMDLEEENIKLRHLLDTNLERMGKLQREMTSYQDKCDKMDHIEVYNKHLQAEMQYLDKEFQSITKKVEELDDEKTKAQVNKTVSVKYSQGYNQTLLKYATYISNTIEALDSKNSVRSRFEELFPKGSSVFKLVSNSDYTNLMLKSFKFIADFLGGLGPDAASPTFSPFSSEVSPAKRRTPSASSARTKSITADVSPFSGHQSPKMSSAAISKRSKDDTLVSSRTASLSISPIPNINISERVRTPQPERPASSSAKKEQKSQNQSQSSNTASFGGVNNKTRSIRSSIATPPNLMKLPDPSGSIRSLKSLNETSKRLETSPRDHPSSSHMTKKSGGSKSSSLSYSREEYNEKTAAELEIIQREKDLIERERDLMARKRELLEKSNRKDKTMSQQSFSEVNSTYVKKLGRNESLEDTTFRNREPESEGGRSASHLKPILKSQHSQGSQGFADGERSNAERSRGGVDPSPSSVHTNSSKLRSAKDLSKVLREKTQHLAQVLNNAGSYEDEIQMANSRSDRDLGNSNVINWKSREMTPMSSFKSLDYDAMGGVIKSNMMKNSQSLALPDQHYEESPFRSGDEANSEPRRRFYGKSDSNAIISNSNIGSYQPSPGSTGRGGPREYKKDRDDYLQKKVSFDHRRVDEMREDQEEMMRSHQRSFSGTQNREYYEDEDGDDAEYEGQDDDQYENAQSQSQYRDGQSEHFGKTGQEEGRGTQFSTFTVSFGRTESGLKRYASPPKEPGSILDTTTKRRVDHMYQTYDVVLGEEKKKLAVREQGNVQYKLADHLSLSDSKRSLTESKRSLTLSAKEPVDKTPRSEGGKSAN